MALYILHLIQIFFWHHRSADRRGGAASPPGQFSGFFQNIFFYYSFFPLGLSSFYLPAYLSVNLPYSLHVKSQNLYFPTHLSIFYFLYVRSILMSIYYYCKPSVYLFFVISPRPLVRLSVFISVTLTFWLYVNLPVVRLFSVCSELIHFFQSPNL